MGLTVRPSTRDEANVFLVAHHRHLVRHVAGHRFALAVDLDGELVGVAVVGRPVARALQGPTTAEVTRLCTDGTPNACSALYGASWRAWRAMGGTRLVTYTLATEPGTSLRASGWKAVSSRGPRDGWDTPARARENTANPGRVRWERTV